MKCEVCNRGEAMSLSYLDNRWVVACMCTSDRESYFIEFDRYYHEGPEVWFNHLLGKLWFNKDDYLKAVFRANLLPTIGKLQ